jgi:DNA-nicking Smr family endonuclease
MADDDDLFWEEVRDVKPLKIRSELIDTAIKKPKPRPIARQLIQDEKNALIDSLSDEYISNESESDDDSSYLRNGHSPDIIKRLKRGYWTIQGSIDLHGMISKEAKDYIVD